MNCSWNGWFQYINVVICMLAIFWRVICVRINPWVFSWVSIDCYDRIFSFCSWWLWGEEWHNTYGKLSCRNCISWRQQRWWDPSHLLWVSGRDEELTLFGCCSRTNFFHLNWKWCTFELFSCEDKSLLIGRDAFFILDFSLDCFDRVRGLHIEGDGLARKGLDKNLHI